MHIVGRRQSDLNLYAKESLAKNDFCQRQKTETLSNLVCDYLYHPPLFIWCVVPARERFRHLLGIEIDHPHRRPWQSIRS